MVSKSELLSLGKLFGIMLFLPTTLHFETRMDYIMFFIHSTLFEITNEFGLDIGLNIHQPFTILYLLLICGPAVYFFFRSKQIDNLDVLILFASICVVTVVLLHGFINIFPPIDVSPELYLNSQNHPALGSFSTMSILFLIVVPTLKRTFSDEECRKIKSRIVGIIRTHSVRTVLVVFLLFPDILFYNTYQFLEQQYSVFLLSGSGWNLSHELLISPFIDAHYFTIVLFPLIGFSISGFRWAFVLSFLYITNTMSDDKEEKRRNIFIGLLILSPYIFLIFYTNFIVVFWGQPSLILPFPIAILIGISFIVKKSDYKETFTEKSMHGKTEDNRQIKVPILQVLYWRLKKLFENE
ncbi:MAG: hypothetical protein GF411_04165 [Candidatus Lokiarchaeota archaeon]|nr:hypothetical protein [Candidatus Lokiarchaeota archaeon]